MFAFSDERGVSLIEIMLALTILATALLAMGGLMLAVAQHTKQATAAGYRSAAATSAVAWVQGIPWDSLDAWASCSSDTMGVFRYDRCLTVRAVGRLSQRLRLLLRRERPPRHPPVPRRPRRKLRRRLPPGRPQVGRINPRE